MGFWSGLGKAMLAGGAYAGAGVKLREDERYRNYLIGEVVKLMGTDPYSHRMESIDEFLEERTHTECIEADVLCTMMAQFLDEQGEYMKAGDWRTFQMEMHRTDVWQRKADEIANM